MNRIRPLELAALLACLAVVVFPQAGASELKPDTISPARWSGSSPEIASDGSGNVIAVWRELTDDTAAIRAAFRPRNGGFEPSELISAPALEAESPRVAMDRLGNAVAVWEESRTGRDVVVQAALRPAGGRWSEPYVLSDPREPAYGADVSIADGKMTAVWIARHNWVPVVRTSSRTLADGWTDAETVSGPVGIAFSPVVALDDHGGAVAAWQLGDGSHRLIQASVRSADGTWSQPELLSTPGHDASTPVLVVDGAGDAIVGWVRSNGTWTAAQTASRKAAGAWGSPRNLSRRGRNAGGIELAMNRRGDAMVAWAQNNRVTTAYRAPDGDHWTRAAITGYWYGGLRFKLALDEQGDATAVWQSSAAISASYKPVGQAWQDDYLLSGWETDSSSVSPSVTAQSADNAMAVWVNEDELDDHVMAVGYDVDTSAREHQDEGGDDEGCEDDCGDDGGDDGASIQGTAHADTLVGTPGNDVFYAHGGNDVIIGLGGRDVVYGGPGNDVIVGGRGSDRLFGGAGRDRLIGGRGNDRLNGGSGRDVLRGGSGDDILRAADRGRDRAFGGTGLDQYRLDRWLDRARSVESKL
jgi:hemolysin type calcium-binding protein